jgi:hypothetical protein
MILLERSESKYWQHEQQLPSEILKERCIQFLNYPYIARSERSMKNLCTLKNLLIVANQPQYMSFNILQELIEALPVSVMETSKSISSLRLPPPLPSGKSWSRRRWNLLHAVPIDISKLRPR